MYNKTYITSKGAALYGHHIIMNKKNIILILIGIFLISLRFNVTFGHINIDITNDCVGFLLIVLGAVHMMHRNSLFKKAGIVSIAGLIASIAAQVINFINWQDAAGTMLSISMGITVIFAIYYTYYFTEALIMEANIQEKSAATRNFQMTWLILSAAIFVHFMAFGASITLYSILVEAVVGICAIYYCFSVYSSSRQLYED